MGERGLRKEGLQNWETGSSNIQTEDVKRMPSELLR